MDSTRAFLRHTLATIAYRGGKAIRGAPASFGEFRIGDSTRTPVQILAHIGDHFDWAFSTASGSPAWNASPPESWNEESARFFNGLEKLDAYLASEAPLGAPAEQLFQGPIADALTHVGQLTMLRRLAGDPVRGENYFIAGIYVGRVGPDQATARREFD